jgi:hypothetical protein
MLSLKGIGISADSITYASVSRSLNTSLSMRPFDGDVLVDFPVGYPVFLGLIQFITRLDPFTYGLFLNGLLFGLLIYITQCLLRKEDIPLPERLLCGACLVFSPALLEVFEMLWSETVFLTLLGLFIAAAAHYGKTHKAGALWTMAIIAAFAGITRYAGMTLALTGGLLLLADRTQSFGKRFWNAFLFGAVSVSLPLANLIRNWFISGLTTGDRKKNFLPLSTHLHRFGGVLSGWLPLLHRYPALYTGCTLLFIAGIAAAFAFFWIHRKEALSIYAVSTAFCVVYSLFILAISLLTEFEGLDTRLLSPLYFPALIGVLGWLHHLPIRGRTPALQPRPRKWLPMALTLLLVGNVVLDSNYLAHPEIAYRNYIRYDMDALKISPTLHFVNTHPVLFGPNVNLYSNAPDLIYQLSTTRADYLPDLHSAEDIRDFSEDKGAYLIWLDGCLAYPGSYMDGMRQIAPLKLVASFPDGAIYVHN